MKYGMLFVVAFSVFASMSPFAHAQQQETSVYFQTTIPLDKGKTTFETGTRVSQTNGGGTTTFDASTNGKALNFKVERTQRR